MNKLRTNFTGKGLASSALNTRFLVALAIALGALFGISSLPLARAAAVTPAEMIQAHLPHAMTLVNAPKADVLSAVCKAITKSPKDAPDIVRTAVGARREIAADILKTAVHCLHEDNTAFDCNLAHATLEQAIAADSEQAAALTELYVGLTPSCVDCPEEGPNAGANAGNINAATGSLGGGAGASSEACAVCHNNQSIQVACAGLNSYLASHPGDTAGACEATPAANR